MNGTICEVDPTFLADAISYSKDVQSQRRNIEKKLASVQSNEFFIRFFIVLRGKDLLDFNLQKKLASKAASGVKTSYYYFSCKTRK